MAAQEIQKVNNFEQEDKLAIMRSIERNFLRPTLMDQAFFGSLATVTLVVAAFTLLNFVDLKNKRVEIVETTRLLYEVTQKSVYSVVCWNALTQSGISPKMQFNATTLDSFIIRCPSLIANAEIASKIVSSEDPIATFGSQLHA